MSRRLESYKLPVVSRLAHVEDVWIAMSEIFARKPTDLPRFNRLAEVPQVSYPGSPRKPRVRTRKSAMERMPNISMKKPRELLRNIEIALELPGDPFDYHLVLQRTCELLYRRRHEHPKTLEEVERIARLDRCTR